MARQAPVGRLAAGVEVHVARGARRRGLAVVERVYRPVPEADHHEATAAEVAGLGMHHCEREAHGDRRVHRVSSLVQDVQAHVARQRVNDRVHPVRRASSDPRGFGERVDRAVECRSTVGPNQFGTPYG